MKLFVLCSIAFVLAEALFNTDEDCIVTNPIGNTIVTAGNKMKIAWSNSHVDQFATIYLVQSDGTDTTPVIIAANVPTAAGQMEVDLPDFLAPSSAYYMTLGEAPYHCVSGNIRILASTTGTVRPPGSVGGSPSEGRYPKPEPADAGLSLKRIPLSLLIFIASLLLFVLS